MKSISLCMIVKNEEKVLERVLKNAKIYADEIIIVDTGSTDNTIEIAKKYTDKVYDFEWCDDFAAARNYSFSLAKSDYIMWLDADDIVPEDTALYISNLKSIMDKDVYMLKYTNGFRDNGEAIFSYYRERIIRNSRLAIWKGAVHECITPFGEVERVNKSIEHHSIKTTKSRRNLDIYIKTKKTRNLTPREQYYMGREYYDNQEYSDCINTLQTFLTEGKGWVENNIDACVVISNAYNILNQKEKELDYLLMTFRFDQPRANVCYYIGNYFFDKRDYYLAIYWYNMSITCNDVSSKGAFVHKDYYDYLPYLQLCLAYFKLNNIAKAYNYNELAYSIYQNETTTNNRQFFIDNYPQLINEV
ncbi:MAG: glycosyltransferase family 2 protein [Clostridia bacterium]|nr:glycosyltransferase family 2 protein [Clostridia bacterium]